MAGCDTIGSAVVVTMQRAAVGVAQLPFSVRFVSSRHRRAQWYHLSGESSDMPETCCIPLFVPRSPLPRTKGKSAGEDG